MTIEAMAELHRENERLERLAERREALTQTLELIARMHRDDDAEYRRRFAGNLKGQ